MQCLSCNCRPHKQKTCVGVEKLFLLNSLEARLKGWFEEMFGTVLFRAIFTIGVICDSLPAPLAKSDNKASYYAIILAALSITLALYLADESVQAAKKAGIVFFLMPWRPSTE